MGGRVKERVRQIQDERGRERNYGKEGDRERDKVGQRKIGREKERGGRMLREK